MDSEPFRILLVEDDRDHADLVLGCLAEFQDSSRVFHVDDGEAAMSFLTRQGSYSDPVTSPVPHLVLLDLRLPRIDGFEVLRQIKTSEELKCIPVIILTTSEAERDVARAYGLHANSYMVKPVTFVGFTKLMHELGLYWLVYTRLPLPRQSRTK